MPREATVTPPGNRLLALLNRDEFARLYEDLSGVELTFKMPLYDRDQPIENVYFVTGGVVSLVSTMDNGAIVEIATVGNEGLVGLPIFLDGDRTATQAFVQVPGSALRMTANAFRRALRELPTLDLLVSRYTLALFTQVAQSAACNRVHSIDERCARWLLMTHDRVGADQFPLTQEFLAQMLGVRRASVSVAASILQRAGLITYARGRIQMLDRAGLERASCECYRIIADEFERLLRLPGAPSK